MKSLKRKCQKLVDSGHSTIKHVPYAFQAKTPFVLCDKPHFHMENHTV